RPKPGKPVAFLRTRSREMDPAISPDGRWLAYRSDESGTFEIYVRPFVPGSEAPTAKWQVSSGGGAQPRWAPVGREVLYASLAGQLMPVTYTGTGEAFRASKPQPWGAAIPPAPSPGSWTYDVAPDGKRILTLQSSELGGADSRQSNKVVFLLNFFDELRRR